MIKTSNHLGSITISKKYLVKLVTSVAESCFGVAGLKGVELEKAGDEVDVKLNVITSGEVNLPAVANAVAHKVSYVLTNKTGIKVRTVEIFTDDIIVD